MPHPFPHLAQRLFNVPLAIRPDKAEIIVAALAQRLGIAQLVRLDGRVVAFDGDGDDSTGAGDPADGYDVVGGIAIVPVAGTLVHKLGTLRPFSGMTGYDGIRANLLAAAADPAVTAIMLDVDSPGGEVSGCFDLADTIFRLRAAKPIWAVLSEGAYSAAYALASACARVIVPATGGVGSIGVITMHVDFSQALAAGGVTVTLIHYGDRKADFADTAPLSAPARTRAQADVDSMGAMFDALVARHRGLPAARIKGFQAATFMGSDGVAAGLADAVMPPDQAFRALAQLASQKGTGR